MREARADEVAERAVERELIGVTLRAWVVLGVDFGVSFGVAASVVARRGRRVALALLAVLASPPPPARPLGVCTGGE